MQRLAIVLLLLCTSTNAAWAGEWADHRVIGAFELRSEFGLQGAAELFADLRRLQADVETLLDAETPDERIRVYLFANSRNYRRYLAQRVPGGADKKALYVKGPDAGRVYVYRHFGFETDVRHECTHALLHATLPYLPLWLDEGLAEYFEVPRDRQAAGHWHGKAARLLAHLGWQPDLRQLERLNAEAGPDGSDYRDCWAVVHFLFHDSPRSRRILTDYLARIRERRPPGPFSDFLKARLPDYPTRLKGHFR